MSGDRNSILRSWASEGLFPGRGQNWIFSSAAKNIFPGGQKWQNFISSTRNYIFCKNLIGRRQIANSMAPFRRHDYVHIVLASRLPGATVG